MSWTLAYRRAHDKEPLVTRGATIRRRFDNSKTRVYSGMSEVQKQHLADARAAAAQKTEAKKAQAAPAADAE